MTGGSLAGAAAVSATDFEYVRTLVRSHAAIALDESKRYLVEARLQPLAREQGLETVARLVARLRTTGFGDLHARTVEAIATTETSFFRDHHPFEALRETVLPELIRRRDPVRGLTVWSAACSGGQEPYSVAMLLRDAFPGVVRDWRVQLLASDLSEAMVAKTREGRYHQHEVNRGLPARYLVRYFRQDGGRWRVVPELRGMVRSFRLNLAEAWSMVPQVDLLLLRNVLIYFDCDDRRRILAKVRRHLRPDGYLVLGSAETTLTLDGGFDRVPVGRSVLYRPKPGGTGAASRT